MIMGFKIGSFKSVIMDVGVSLTPSSLAHSMKLYKERPRLNVRANSFSNRVANTWNQLPESVIMAPSLNAFKGRLNAHWKRHPKKFNPACYETGTTTGQRF